MQDVRILVVEDERKLAEVLASALRAEHYDVVLAPTGEDGFFRVQAETFDVVLLDLMLPGRNGLEILQTLRKRHVQTPVLILTARDGIDDRVLGLDLGADDYLIKPFALPELLARIRALLRRGRPTETLRLKAGDLELDLMSRRVTRAGRPLDLTAASSSCWSICSGTRDTSCRAKCSHTRSGRSRATPIDNVIDVQVARLRRKVDSDEAIGSMLEEIDRMSTLVETPLRLSRGDAGSIRLSRETVDLGELARDVAASLGVLAEERNQTIDFDVPDGLTITADRLVLREAVTNVLDNAIKYGPERSAITIRAERTGNQALLAIADDGPGIPPEDRERIFHRFFRLDEARSRERGGTGLGLAIARWAVKIHGRRISADGRPGGGSEFRMLLPLAQPAVAGGENRTAAAG